VNRPPAPVIRPGDRQPLSALRAPSGGGGRVWAMASGSGGVGRTTLAGVLASRMVRQGHRVCAVDGDWTAPGLAGLLGVHATGPGAWEGGATARSREHGELQVLGAGAPLEGDPGRPAGRSLRAHLASLQAERVVLDLPAGGSAVALDLWLAADVPLLVTAPERLPVEATGRLLARVFARRVTPWLARRLGSDRAREALRTAWTACEGRPAGWLRAVAREAAVNAGDLAARAGKTPIYLVLNRARRGDDVDVGHALVRAGRDGLGLDLRFRAVLPFEDDGWIQARRPGAATAGAADLLGMEVDDLLRRMARDEDVAAAGDWKWSLQQAATAVVG
jgi:MinD-like ATPase involved in chromosome partitioning or flagellar assembly